MQESHGEGTACCQAVISGKQVKGSGQNITICWEFSVQAFSWFWQYLYINLINFLIIPSAKSYQSKRVKLYSTLDIFYI